MSEIKKTIAEVSIHPFQPLRPDTRPESRDSARNKVIQTEPKIYGTNEGISDLIQAKPSRADKKKSTIMSAGLMMTNACLGTTIFTFAVKAKSFGLVWFLVAVIIVGIINYWTIMAGAKASSKVEEDDYSEITQINPIRMCGFIIFFIFIFIVIVIISFALKHNYK